MDTPNERDPTLPSLLVRRGIAMREWKMGHAKARLSELIKTAQQQGPQHISLHGKTVAVVLSKEDFDRLSGRRQSLAAFIAASPLAEAAADVELPPRLRDPPKEVGF